MHDCGGDVSARIVSPLSRAEAAERHSPAAPSPARAVFQVSEQSSGRLRRGFQAAVSGLRSDQSLGLEAHRPVTPDDQVIVHVDVQSRQRVDNIARHVDVGA